MALSMEEIGLLSDTQKQRYAELERLFEQPAWNTVKLWATNNAREQEVRLINAATWDENRIAAGARAAYLHVLNIEEVTEHEFRLLGQQNVVAADDVEVAGYDAGNQR